MSTTDHTSDPMSDDVLDELMSLVAAATPGQWWYGTPDDTTQTVAEWMATCSPDPDAPRRRWRGPRRCGGRRRGEHWHDLRPGETVCTDCWLVHPDGACDR